MKKNPYYLPLIFLLFTSCSYHFSSDSFEDLEIPDASDTTITLKNFNNLDPINIRTRMDIIFDGEPNQFVTDSKVYLDGETITVNWQDNAGYFILMPYKYIDGIHEIRVQLFFSSGSGSLKDQSGLEILEKNQIFKFTVKRNPSEPPKINEVKMENGSVRINWSPPVNKDYKEVFISLKYKYSEIRIPLTESDLNSGTYLDTYTILFTENSSNDEHDHYSFVDYSIVYTSEYSELYGENIKIVDDPSLFKIKIGYNDNNSHKIVWTEHPFYGNITSLKYEDIDFSSRGGEHIVNTPYEIGKSYSGSIVIRGDGGNLPDRFFSYSYYKSMELDENSLGLFDFNDLYSKGIIYNPSNQNYYALVVEEKNGYNYVYYIYKYSNNMEFIEKRYIGGKEQYSRNEEIYLDPIDHNIYVDTREHSYLIDKNSLQVVKEYIDSNNDLNDYSYRNNVVKFYSYASDELTLTNTSTGTILYSSTVEHPGYLSRSGKYVYLQTNNENSIYKINNNSLEKVYDISPNYNLGVNVFFEDDILYYALNNEIFIVDLVTKHVKSFSYGSVSIRIKVDSVGQKILVIQNGTCAVYDMQTEQIKTFKHEYTKYIRGLFNSEDRDYYLNLYNDRLIHSKGIFINNFYSN